MFASTAKNIRLRREIRLEENYECGPWGREKNQRTHGR